jgi:hypothetical protein
VFGDVNEFEKLVAASMAEVEPLWLYNINED